MLNLFMAGTYVHMAGIHDMYSSTKVLYGKYLYSRQSIHGKVLMVWWMLMDPFYGKVFMAKYSTMLIDLAL